MLSLKPIFSSMLIVLMGVSGSGKTTIGQLLSSALHTPFFDADDYHPASNIEKMSQGIALNDQDRLPWLQTLGKLLHEQEGKTGAILACSALKESYRTILQQQVSSKIRWIHLEGNKELISQRLQQRSGHFMSSNLLDSQFDTLEKPNQAYCISVQKTPEEIIQDILSYMKNTMQHQIGLIGLGVMGSSLALNIRDKGFKIAVYNRQSATEVDVAHKFAEANSVQGFDDLSSFVASIAIPRKILLMVNAGQAVDEVIKALVPLLQPGDLIMDGGNSHYEDTKRRNELLQKQGLMYMGVGISGGEEGARRGPAIMPGGSYEAYELVAPILDAIAAKNSQQQPCSVYIGPEGAGHFVKMVHNGIEYAEMQILAETYALMKDLLGYSPELIAQTLDHWKQEGEGSYLLEITRDILLKKEQDDYLLDKILDAAEQKGTGGWTLKAALDLNTPLNTITDAVTARMLSSMKDTRVKTNAAYASVFQHTKSHTLTSDDLKAAYKATRRINHIIGFAMMHNAATSYEWKLNLGQIADIWTNGCIIRSTLMEKLAILLPSQHDLLLHPEMVQELGALSSQWSKTVGQGLQNNITLPVYSSGLNYFLSMITAQSPANLIQAQRDFFGAHKYKRIDSDPNKYFHTQW